jgi:membrane-associated phospholipid phosphatase
MRFDSLDSAGKLDRGRGRHADVARAVVALATTLGSAMIARTPGLSRAELFVFRRVNGLTPSFELPLAAVMQLGSLGAVFAAAGVAMLARRRKVALQLLTSGGIAYIGARVVKIIVARERPGLLIAEVLLRGRPQSGRGFPSGHAAVAAALATIGGRHLPAEARGAAWASAGVVALARVYVGAHLPIDVVGGAALGYAIASSVAAAIDE